MTLLDTLREILGDEGLVSSRYGRAMYRRDAGFINAEPLAVSLPSDVEQVQAVVRACREAGVPFTPRGSGTGLAGGAVGLHGAVVIALTRMNRIQELNVEGRYAWVEPGVVNAELDRVARRQGLRYAPDPSSQTASTIGGNVGTNAGGPHCLAHGVTSWHVLALEMVDAEGELHRLGSLSPEENGFDVRGLVVGSEGTFGVVTRIAVQLHPVPEQVRTILLPFAAARAAADTVSALIARGCIPVALELMDAAAIRLVEQFARAGYPTEAGAVLLVEFEGLEHEVREGTEATVEEAVRHGSQPRIASTDEERQGLWKGRKAIAGAIALESPDYYLQDVVVPRTRLADVLDRVMQIAEEEEVKVVNVAHAGDGNLHPLILFDREDPGQVERVFRAGDRMVHVALEAGGVLSGEHGIGIEKRNFLHEAGVMTEHELSLHLRVRHAMDPSGLANPGKKVVPTGSGAGTIFPEGTWM